MSALASSLLRRAVRFAAVLLVLGGAGVRPAPADEPPKPPPPKDPKDQAEPWPDGIDVADVKSWWEHATRRTAWALLKWQVERIEHRPSPDPGAVADIRYSLSAVPTGFADLLREELPAHAEGRPAPVYTGRRLLSVARELAGSGIYDPWAIAWLWRLAARSDVKDSVDDLFAELSRQARVADALTVAAGDGLPKGPYPGPWRSKGANPHRPPRMTPGQLQSTAERLLADAKKAWPKVGPATWRKDGLVSLTVGDGSPRVTLVRDGRERTVAPGETILFGRLDLLEALPGGAPAVLEHERFGRVRIPPGVRVAAWNLPARLTPKAKAKVEAAVERAMDGDEAAAERLERALPLAHEAIRKAAAAQPDAKGAPRLRTILALWDR